MFYFDKSLKVGKEGEDRFFNHFSGRLIKADGLKYDFVTVDGLTLELKSDSYDMEKTENFFFERYSDFERKTPGGIWQSKSNEVDLFVYYFPQNDYFYCGNVNDIVESVETLQLDEKDLLKIPNKSWTTAGWKIKRDLLTEVMKGYNINVTE